jgi:hypothetical protein
VDVQKVRGETSLSQLGETGPRTEGSPTRVQDRGHGPTAAATGIGLVRADRVPSSTTVPSRRRGRRYRRSRCVRRRRPAARAQVDFPFLRPPVR